MGKLIDSAKEIIAGIENYIHDPYSAEGFYKLFIAGFLPVPYLWGNAEEFKYAKAWETKFIKGGIQIVGQDNKPVTSEQVVAHAKDNMKEVEYILKELL